MPIIAKVDGSNKQVDEASTKVKGTWKEIVQGWTKVSGSWKEIFTSFELVFYQANADTRKIYKLDETGAVIQESADLSSYGGLNVYDIGVDPIRKRLFISPFNARNAFCLDAETLEVLWNKPDIDGSISVQVTSIDVNSAGHVLFVNSYDAQASDSPIYDENGTLLASYYANGYYLRSGILDSANGKVWLSNQTAYGWGHSGYPNPYNLNTPTNQFAIYNTENYGMDILSDGSILVVENSGLRLIPPNPTTTTTPIFVQLAPDNVTFRAGCVDEDDYIYAYAYYPQAKIYKISRTGEVIGSCVISTSYGEGSKRAKLNVTPEHVVVALSGKNYIIDKETMTLITSYDWKGASGGYTLTTSYGKVHNFRDLWT
jgi:hypothetical protein